MKRTTYHASKDEDGAAIVEMVLVIPIVVLLMAGLLDLSAYIKCNITMDSAATAAARFCMDDPSNSTNQAAISSYLARIDSELSDVKVSVETGKPITETYTHYLYPDISDNHIERPGSVCTYTPFVVELTCTKSFFTPIGRGISLASGGDGSLTVTSRQAGQLDMTKGDTW